MKHTALAGALLFDREDDRSGALMHALVDRLARDPRHGIDQVSTSAVIPGAPIVVSMRSGFRVGSAFTGPLVRQGRPGGTHGYLPNNEAMDAALFLVGDGVPAGVRLERIDMRDIAPTLAPFLGVSLPSAEGRNLLER